ncbi:putative nuclease HARBI1 [Bombina bombina]|uniref:putative nuclease HARBI1 n=1 Tax=Bombina bombina TaxID=8345 RepID=UPI00235A6C6A|nr:putative nuclease HARBI1 [Bombina bombina]
MAAMPNVLGTIDCTHVAVRPLQAREEIYRNRKHFHSLNVQMICDPNMRIISVRSNYPGSCHDSYILRQTGLYRKFKDGDMPKGWLLGDGGYSCTEWLVTPYNNLQTRNQVCFNEAHQSTRG